MAGGGSSKSNAPKPRKRVEADSASSAAPPTLVRAKDGSAFARCDECNKNVPVALISFHDCSLDAKIKMNLEAQVVETPAEVKKKPAERKKPTSSEPKAKRLRKKGSDSSKPKRPPTAFFLFMDDFRKEFKAANPDAKGAKEVAKQGGEKWKNMTDEEKKPYVDKAAELKAEYGKALKSNDAENEDDGEGGSEKDADEKDTDEKDDDEKDANEKEVQEEEAKEEAVQEEEEILDDY